jgi:hypothetical protein
MTLSRSKFGRKWWANTPRTNKAVYAGVLIIAILATLASPLVGLLIPNTQATFVSFCNGQLNSKFNNANIALEWTGIQLQAHGPLSAGTPLTVDVTAKFNETAFSLAETAPFPGSFWANYSFTKPSTVSIVLNGAYLVPPEKNAYGFPVWARIDLQHVGESHGIDVWKNNRSAIVNYYDSGRWGYTVYYGPNSRYDANPSCYFNDDDPHGVVIEPYSVVVNDATNSLIVSFTMFIVALTLLGLRKPTDLAQTAARS